MTHHQVFSPLTANDPYYFHLQYPWICHVCYFCFCFSRPSLHQTNSIYHFRNYHLFLLQYFDYFLWVPQMGVKIYCYCFHGFDLLVIDFWNGWWFIKIPLQRTHYISSYKPLHYWIFYLCCCSSNSRTLCNAWWCKCSILFGNISSHGRLLKLFSRAGDIIAGGSIGTILEWSGRRLCELASFDSLSRWLSLLINWTCCCWAIRRRRISSSLWRRATSWNWTGLGWEGWSQKSGLNLW